MRQCWNCDSQLLPDEEGIVHKERTFCTRICIEQSDPLAARTADRHDSGKPELSHVDVFPVAQEGVALNAAYGASKYDLWNFLKGAKSSLESYNCARRHMSKWLNGEDLVPDAVEKGFNVHHIDAAIWNLMRLRQELVTFPDRDNRPRKVLGRAK